MVDCESHGEQSHGERDSSDLLIEVIVTSPGDAEAAHRGGADRLELVSSSDRGGMTPDPNTLQAVREVTDLPVRVMLRRTDSHVLDRGTTALLVEDVGRLVAAGADAFVAGALTTGAFTTGSVTRGSVTRGSVTRGLLTTDLTPDDDALEAVIRTMAGRPWTFHRALDDCGDLTAAVTQALTLPGCDGVLVSGHAAGLDQGLERVVDLLADDRIDPAAVVVGGGLRDRHLSALMAAGARNLHCGRQVREGGTWSGAVSAALVSAVRVAAATGAAAAGAAAAGAAATEAAATEAAAAAAATRAATATTTTTRAADRTTRG